MKTDSLGVPRFTNKDLLDLINLATSIDGKKWHRYGKAIPFKIGHSQAFSKPSVIKDENNIYHMWFSYKGSSKTKYKIGYAKSLNGFKWQLDFDKVGISTSKRGWDSEMICYPYVFKFEGKIYMLYNGNGYGKTGFGLALLKN